METAVLQRLGLSDSDTKVYLSLLRLGAAYVTQIAEDSGVHRTNIYSILDKLKSMGLVSDFLEGNKRKFKVTDPENLLNYLRESEVAVKNLLGDLKKIQETVKEKVEVEVLRGEKGMKSAFKDIIREKKEVAGFG
ncbi:MAG: helix-turn-helix domain-containing protein, partial [Candidatus Diapherotrites archaeon]